jgi:hypothetical protein
LTYLVLNDNLVFDSKIYLIKYIIENGYDVKKHDGEESLIRFILHRCYANQIELVNFFVNFDIDLNVSSSNKINTEKESLMKDYKIDTNGNFVYELFRYIDATENSNQQEMIIHILRAVFQNAKIVVNKARLLDCVIYSQSLEVLKWLFLQYPNEYNIDALKIQSSESPFFRVKTYIPRMSDGDSIIYCVCQTGDPKLIQCVLDFGNAIDLLVVENRPYHRTPFYLIMKHVNDIVFIDHVYSMIRGQINILDYIDLRSYCDNRFELTDWILKVLVEENKINSHDYDGYAIIHYTAMFEEFELFTKAVNMGANQFVLTRDGENIFDLIRIVNTPRSEYDSDYSDSDDSNYDSDNYTEYSVHDSDDLDDSQEEFNHDDYCECRDCCDDHGESSHGNFYPGNDFDPDHDLNFISDEHLEGLLPSDVDPRPSTG